MGLCVAKDTIACHQRLDETPPHAGWCPAWPLGARRLLEHGVEAVEVTTQPDVRSVLRAMRVTWMRMLEVVAGRGLGREGT